MQISNKLRIGKIMMKSGKRLEPQNEELHAQRISAIDAQICACCPERNMRESKSNTCVCMPAPTREAGQRLFNVYLH